MHVPEELPDIPIGTSVAQERIVIEDDALATNAYGHLLRYLLKTMCIPGAHVLDIVISKDQIYLPMEPVHDVVPVGGVSLTEVTQVEYDAVFRDGFVPAADEFIIHFGGIPEGTVAECNDVVVAEMGIGSKPDVVQAKLIHHSRLDQTKAV